MIASRAKVVNWALAIAAGAAFIAVLQAPATHRIMASMTFGQRGPDFRVSVNPDASDRVHVQSVDQRPVIITGYFLDPRNIMELRLPVPPGGAVDLPMPCTDTCTIPPSGTRTPLTVVTDVGSATFPIVR